jgi:hypothetical protein
MHYSVTILFIYSPKVTLSYFPIPVINLLGIST